MAKTPSDLGSAAAAAARCPGGGLWERGIVSSSVRHCPPKSSDCCLHPTSPLQANAVDAATAKRPRQVTPRGQVYLPAPASGCGWHPVRMRTPHPTPFGEATDPGPGGRLPREFVPALAFTPDCVHPLRGSLEGMLGVEGHWRASGGTTQSVHPLHHHMPKGQWLLSAWPPGYRGSKGASEFRGCKVARSWQSELA